MVIINSAKGLKAAAGYWADKVLVGGSTANQTTGNVIEAVVSGTQANIWVNGGISGTSILATDSISGANLNLSGSIVAAGNYLMSTGSPYKTGIVHQFTARAICSGGAFVWLSGPALAMGSPFITATPPIGVALATAASNATVNVLTHGIYPMIAEGTVLAGAPVKQGIGVATGAYNTVLDAGSPSFGVIGTTLTGGASEATVFVYVGKGNSS